MRAAVLHGVEDLRVERVASPVAGAGELVLNVGAALTCGTDLKVYKRGYHAAMGRPPMLFGHEVAGTVVGVGDGVAGFAVGDRVVPMNSAPCDACFFCLAGQQNLCEDLLFNNGAYAEFLRVPARIVEKNTLALPDGLAFEHAALTEPLACAVRGVEESGARAGTTMIVIGAGPLGLMLMQVAALGGVRVIAVVKRAVQGEVARRFGAAEVVLLEKTDDPVGASRALTGDGRGADVVIEAVATPETWVWAVGMVRKGGVVNFFGGPPAGTVVGLDTNRLHYGDITLKASFHHTPAACRTAFELIASGRFGAGEMITSRSGLEEVPEVFAGMMSRGGDRPAGDQDGGLSRGGGLMVDALQDAVLDPLRGGPEEYRTPEERPTLEEARAWCKRLTGAHYENFHVATFFLPANVRPYFESIYAYCRVADDLGDEVADTRVASRLLTSWGEMLEECYDRPEESRHPVFVALREAVVACELPRQLFLDLLMAFQMDQVKTEYASMGELMEYSRYSANPVGRLVLWVCGYKDEKLAVLSDMVCTALQLANFWQDVVEDAERGRRYLPGVVMERCGVDEGQILGRVFTPELGLMMESLVAETRGMLREGAVLNGMVDGELGVTLTLFSDGGEAILDGIAGQGYDVLRGRPVVTKAKKLLLLGRAMVGKVRVSLGSASRSKCR